MLLPAEAAPSGDTPCPAAPPVLSGSAPLRAVKAHLRSHEPVRILAIGSSSTEGIGASAPRFAYPPQLEAFLDAAWRNEAVSVENAGIGGETAAQTVRRLELELQDAPDLVIWQIGTNDAVRGIDVDQFAAMLERGLKAARAVGVEVILLDQQFYPGIADVPRYERFVAAVRETGARHKVPVFSRYGLMKAWGQGSLPELRTMLAGDGFHMSDRGYACLTRALGGAVAALAESSPPPAATASALSMERLHPRLEQ